MSNLRSGFGWMQGLNTGLSCWAFESHVCPNFEVSLF